MNKRGSNMQKSLIQKRQKNANKIRNKENKSFIKFFKKKKDHENEKHN